MHERHSALVETIERQRVDPLRTRRHTTRCSAADTTLAVVATMAAFSYRDRLDPVRLRAALARVLADYGVFAGRLRMHGRQLDIEHGVGGAVFEVARSRVPRAVFWDTARRAIECRSVCPALSAVRALVARGPLFGVRLTHTADGSVLGVVWNHAVGDASSAVQFLRAWAQAYRGLPYDVPHEVTDRRAYLDERLPRPAGDQRHSRLLSWPEFFRVCRYYAWEVRDVHRVAWDFSREEIAAIHGAASRDHEVSEQDALCAHVLFALRRQLGSEVSGHFAMAVNLRKRLGLPQNLLGNLSDFVRVTARERDDIGAFAAALRAAVSAYGTGAVTERELAAFHASEPSPLAMLRYVSQPWEPCRMNLTVTNVSSMGWEEVAFDSAPASTFFRGTTMTSAGAVGFLSLVKSPDGAGLSFDGLLPSKLAERLAAGRALSVCSVGVTA